MAFIPDTQEAPRFVPDEVKTPTPPATAYDKFLNSLRNPQTGGRSGVVGPMILGGTGELIKGAGALTQFAFPEAGNRMVEVGSAITEGAKSVAPVSTTVGQIGSYVAPFSAAQKGLNVVGNIPTVAKATSMIPSFARATGQQATIGAGTGYALTPDQENREQSAFFGALGGAGGELIKPVVKAGGNVISEAVGNLSGVGSQAYKTAYGSAVQGGEKLKALAENLRKKVPVNQVVDDALLGLTNMGKDLQQKYRSGMVDIKKDKSVLDFDAIDDALVKSLERGRYKGEVFNPKVDENINKARQAVDEWKSLDPIEYHTPEGMDALKKKIGGILEEIPFEQRSSRDAVGDIYTAVKQSISKQAPTYNDVMKNYSEGLELASELKRTLSLKDTSTADSALRKLQSVMRNNVNTNYGNRVNYAEMLEQASGKPIMSQLAGQSLSSVTPRGLQQLSASGLTAASLFNPSFAPLVAMSSPRLMGEATVLAGKASRPFVNLANTGTPEQRQLAKLLIMKAAEQGVTNE